VGDRVVVKARIAKGETPDPAATIAAKQVVDKSAKAAADSGDTGDDAGQPATDTTP
ncbi:MAG: hypothetical protein QOD53_1092, partial [Thermoleophilaceae bacterium]|nr:hypothetical protein [Thermoleophilaceae bacterium]